LHQELVKQPETLSNGNPETNRKPADLINVSVFGMRDEFTELDLRAWHPVPVYPFSVRGPRSFGYAPGLSSRLMALHPDLVHVHGLWQYNSVATLACRNRLAPVLAGLRNSGQRSLELALRGAGSQAEAKAALGAVLDQIVKIED
jgi:hypothetical protein